MDESSCWEAGERQDRDLGAQAGVDLQSGRDHFAELLLLDCCYGGGDQEDGIVVFAGEVGFDFDAFRK